MTPESLDALIARIATRDARDALERATCWVVSTYHPDYVNATQTVSGPFAEPAAALAYAHDHEREMREDDARWKCTVLPVFPILAEGKKDA